MQPGKVLRGKHSISLAYELEQGGGQDRDGFRRYQTRQGNTGGRTVPYRTSTRPAEISCSPSTRTLGRPTRSKPPSTPAEHEGRPSRTKRRRPPPYSCWPPVPQNAQGTSRRGWRKAGCVCGVVNAVRGKRGRYCWFCAPGNEGKGPGLCPISPTITITITHAATEPMCACMCLVSAVSRRSTPQRKPSKGDHIIRRTQQ